MSTGIYTPITGYKVNDTKFKPKTESFVTGSGGSFTPISGSTSAGGGGGGGVLPDLPAGTGSDVTKTYTGTPVPSGITTGKTAPAIPGANTEFNDYTTPGYVGTPVKHAEGETSISKVTGGLSQYVSDNATGTGEVKYKESPYIEGSNPQVDGVLTEMDANSKAWHDASPEERLALQAKNKELAASLSDYGVDAGFNTVTGKWNFLKKTPVMDENSWRTMSYDEIYSAISEESSHITENRQIIWDMANKISEMGNVDYAAIIFAYEGRIEEHLLKAEQRLEERRAKGMDDPGLQAALQILREDGEMMRSQLLENLNARGISRSGLLAEAELRLARGQMSQEQLMVGEFLSMLETNYQNSMDNILNQRVGYLNHSKGLAVEGAFKQEELKMTAARHAADIATDVYGYDRQAESENKRIAATMYGDNQDRAVQENANLGNQFLQAGSLAEQINNNLRSHNLDVDRLNHTIANDAEMANIARKSAEDANTRWENDYALRKYDSEVETWYKGETLDITRAQTEIDKWYKAELVNIDAFKANLSAEETAMAKEQLELDKTYKLGMLELEERRADMSDKEYELAKDTLEIQNRRLENEETWQDFQIETETRNREELDEVKAESHLASSKAIIDTYAAQLDNGDVSLVQLLDMIRSGDLYNLLGIDPNKHDVERENIIYNSFVDQVFTEANKKYNGIFNKIQRSWAKTMAGATGMTKPTQKIIDDLTIKGYIDEGSDTYKQFTP